MKFRHLAGLAVIALLAGTGCEWNEGVRDDEAAAAGFRITPAGAHLRADDIQITFTLHEGQPPYRWVVANEDLGDLLAPGTRDHRVVYARAEGANGVNTLRVTDARGWVARVIILQDQTGDDD